MMHALLLAAALLTTSPARDPALCISAGTLVACADPVATPLCWSTRDQRIVPCSSLPRDTDGAANRASRAVIGKGIDLFTTAVAIYAGAREGNSHVPTVEHRIGGGLVAIGVQIAAQEVIARKSPKWATRVSRIVLLGYVGVGVNNLIQADRARKAARSRSGG
jgi:hypothetical protein